MTSSIPRGEHPRPDFCRDSWITLNGPWDFSMGQDTFDQTIMVPFAPESKLSGIGDTGFHPVVWYRRSFTVPEAMQNRRILLHFGAVDYACRVWVNDSFVTSHTGGQSSFSVDITHAVRFTGENTVVVRAQDAPQALDQMRGKQFWEEESRGIFYTRTTGIWQSVWLEAVDEVHLEQVRITPLYDEKSVRFDYQLSCGEQHGPLALQISISLQGRPVLSASLQPESLCGSATFVLDRGAKVWNFTEELSWSPEHPRLLDVEFRVWEDGCCRDMVRSYFGMRKVSIENGVFLLNNRPYFQKLVLDQGYWPDALMTAPTDEAFISDLQMIKEMGFNGLRMHQKAEDPRFYYHADRLGLLVWAEIGSAYLYSPDYAQQFYKEWSDCVLRDYNHPCIIVWTPLNESWGILEIDTDSMQQAHSRAAYYITKSLDATRLVIDNDGWEHTFGDLLTIHDYESDASVWQTRYATLDSVLAMRPGGRSLFASGHEYHGQPIIVSEYGGILLATDTAEDSQAWGYSSDRDPKAYAAHIARLNAQLLQSPLVQGYCYTQLCDVETEQNGLLTYDRQPKVPLSLIAAANQGFLD